MSKLLICSESDTVSRNVKAQLFSLRKWEGLGTDGRNTFDSFGDNVMLTTPDAHITSENIDDVARNFGIVFDEIVFMSRHTAASGKPALTVHPIGNYKDSNLGGRPESLVRSAPALMTDALRRIAIRNDTGTFSTSFEVTHHGPWVDTPSMFIEIGSDENNWGDINAAGILANVILDTEKDESYPNVIGVGGGHYAPRFTELALKYKVNVGHMVPNYQMDGSTDDEIIRMIVSAAEATSTKLVYIHRKSMKKSEEAHISGLIGSVGLEIMASKDFEPLV